MKSLDQRALDVDRPRTLGQRVLEAVRRDFIGRFAIVVAGTAAAVALHLLLQAFPQVQATTIGYWLGRFLSLLFGLGH